MSKQIEYIDTGVNWLGKIPSTWESKRIKMLTRVKRGASPRPIDNPIYFDEEGEFAWVRIADVTASERYLENTTQRLSELGSSASVKRYPDDFFLSIAGTVGKPIITKIKCCIHDGFVYFPDLKINPEFLYYIFSTGLPYLGLGKLGTQLNLNTDTVGDIYIPIPEEKEIEKIVNYLDERTAEIDNLIYKKQKLIDCLKEESLQIISQAVTKGIKPNVDLKPTKNDWFPNIPVHWGVKKITYGFNKIGSGTTPTSGNPDYYFDGEFNWLQTGDLNDNFITETSKRITQKALDDYSTLRFYEEGSLVIAMYGATIGKCGLLKIKTTTNQACCVLSAPTIFNSHFVFYWFLSNKVHIVNLSYGGGQPNISQEVIRSLRIPCPSVEEQLEIVDFLNMETSRIENIIKKIENEIELIKEYRTSLINEVVTGKITLN